MAPTLLTEAERQVAAGGHDVAWLAVARGNAMARRFYEKRGWVDEGDLDYHVEAGGTPYVSPCRRYTRRVRRDPPRPASSRQPPRRPGRSRPSTGTPFSWWPSR